VRPLKAKLSAALERPHASTFPRDTTKYKPIQAPRMHNKYNYNKYQLSLIDPRDKVVL